MDLMQALANIPLIGPYLPYVTAILAVLGAVAHFVAPYIPPPSSQYGFYAMLYGLVNMLGGNRGQAANANAPVK